MRETAAHSRMALVSKQLCSTLNSGQPDAWLWKGASGGDVMTAIRSIARPAQKLYRLPSQRFTSRNHAG